MRGSSSERKGLRDAPEGGGAVCSIAVTCALAMLMVAPDWKNILTMSMPV